MRALALLLLALPASADPITKAGDILKNRDAMDGRAVCLVGKTKSVEERYGKVTGQHLFRGKFDDGTGEVLIFSYGFFPKIAVGETIEVCGRYAKAYVAPSKVIYKDQIAITVLLKDKGINAGKVDIVGDKVVAAGKGTSTAQATRPPAPGP